MRVGGSLIEKRAGIAIIRLRRHRRTNAKSNRILKLLPRFCCFCFHRHNTISDSSISQSIFPNSPPLCQNRHQIWKSAPQDRSCREPRPTSLGYDWHDDQTQPQHVMIAMKAQQLPTRACWLRPLLFGIESTGMPVLLGSELHLFYANIYMHTAPTVQNLGPIVIIHHPTSTN